MRQTNVTNPGKVGQTVSALSRCPGRALPDRVAQRALPRRKLPHHTLPRLLAMPHRTALTAAAASAASAASASSAAVSHSPPALPRHTPALPPPPPQAPLVRHRRQQSSARWMAARRMHDSAALASVAPRIAPPLPRPRINFVLQFNVFSALAALGSCICQHRRAVADPGVGGRTSAHGGSPY